jgi:hypothetical protein
MRSITRIPLLCAALAAGSAPVQAQLQSHALSQTQAQALPMFLSNNFDRPVLTLALSERTTLVFQPPERRPWGDYPGLAPEPPRQALGLEFKAARPSGLPPHVLRVQLSSKETLQFRPRGGGLAVTYRAQF